MAAKKKKAKKKAGKKKAGTTSRNRTDLKLDVRKGSAIDGGPAYLYHVHLKSGSGSVTAGAVVAKSTTEATAKAKRLLRSLC